MEWLLDTADIREIEELIQIIKIVGVTTNPSILSMDKRFSMEEQLLAIKEIIGHRQLHVQLISQTYHRMMEEAEKWLSLLGDQIYLKIPVNNVGLKVIGELNEMGIKVTGTAIYTELQAYLALNNGVNYVAPYYNRIANNNMNPSQLVKRVARVIEQQNSRCKLLIASFSNLGQVTQAISDTDGKHALTITPKLLKTSLINPLVETAIQQFTDDAKSIK